MGCSGGKQAVDSAGAAKGAAPAEGPRSETAEASSASPADTEKGKEPVYAPRMLKDWNHMNEEEREAAKEEAEIRVEYAVGPPMSDGDVPVLITMSPAEGSGRTPSDIVCVIDISWSMTMEAKVVGGNTESNGLSMLDVAKHAVRAVLHTLGPEDRFGIVEFCRQSRTVLPLTRMDKNGHEQANRALGAITFGNGTQLWQGIRAGLDELCATQREGRIGHLMVLTDGETEDKDQVMDLLKQRREDNNGQLQGTINCFGFGYEIDSYLLSEIARFSDGAYAFIPDAGFVGTIFVNSISNLLVTTAKDVYLHLKATDSGACPKLLTEGYDSTEMADGTLKVAIGLLQCGQTRDIVVSMTSGVNIAAPFKSVTVTYHTAPWGSKPREREGKMAARGSKDAAVEVNLQRSLFLTDLAESISFAKTGKSCEKAELEKGFKTLTDKCAKRVEKSITETNEMELKALLEDITGEVGVAFASKESWDKWGRHYVPSVAFAHRLQQCNNFKDPGVQFYGGDVFANVRDLADEAFNKLAAPVITPAQFRYLGGGKVIENPSYQHDMAVSMGDAGVARPATITMAAYNDRYAGCIDGACHAQLANGERKPVASLAKGDVVVCAGGRSAELVCSMRTRCAEGVANLVELSEGPRLTPHHPVQFEGRWCFPADLAPVQQLQCEAVFSFVLSGAPDLLVDGVPCIALGHCIQEGAARHPYFGSELVLRDLSAMPGFSAGLVELRPLGVQRDPQTGLVCGLAPQA